MLEYLLDIEEQNKCENVAIISLHIMNMVILWYSKRLNTAHVTFCDSVQQALIMIFGFSDPLPLCCELAFSELKLKLEWLWCEPIEIVRLPLAWGPTPNVDNFIKSDLGEVFTCFISKNLNKDYQIVKGVWTK